MSRVFDAILFDMDGVVVDSEPVHEKAQRTVIREFGLKVPESAFSDFKGMTEDKVYALIAARYGTNGTPAKRLVAAKHAAFASLADELQMVRGASALITSLHAAGCTLGLVTSAASWDQARAFEKFGLEGYFQAVVTGADVSKPKPYPEPYLLMAYRLNVTPEACLVIEDSRYGVQSARRAGCRVFGLATTFTSDQLLESGAHRTFGSMQAIAQVLRAQSGPQDRVA